MKKVDEDEENQRALSGARTIAGIALAASVVALLGWRFRGTVTLWQWWLSMAASLALGALVTFTRKMRTLSSGLVSLACVAITLFASSVTIYQVFSAHIQNEPYESYKLAALVLGIIAIRPRWLGYLAISLCGVIPIVLQLTVLIEFRKSTPIQEPIVTTMFALISLWLYRYRIRSTELERTLARARAQEESLVRTTKVVLALRDLSNTPIQTLTATTALLQDETTSRAEIARMSENALRRLGELSKILESYQGQIDWSRFGESFDAVAVLEELVKSSPTVTKPGRPR